ncbi:MAG TPA: PEP-CTERM sorting domain-containing protein [Burkholderiaceae bacterium]|nr:PEP-CTERM sorting domain-containing protein [Burkholderiaceae bacterium]
MKVSARHAFCAASLALGFAASTVAHAVAVVTLPTPGSFVDGVPTNQVYDQGLVYSAVLLDQMQTAGLIPATNGDYRFSTGTGNIPVLVYTGAGGASNESPFQDPLAACGGGACTSFDGTWGLGSDPGTVGALRTALGGSQMMFYFDHNEQEGAQAVPNLRASGRFAIYDGATEIVSYAFDNTANGVYDQTSWVTSCSTATIGPGPGGSIAPPCDFSGITTTSGATYVLNSNSGSGKPDFFVVFPQFDLYSIAYDPTYRIVVEMHLRDLDPGFDELGIAGYLFETTTHETPEPGTLALLGLSLGLLGLAAALRRKQQG